MKMLDAASYNVILLSINLFKCQWNVFFFFVCFSKSRNPVVKNIVLPGSVVVVEGKRRSCFEGCFIFSSFLEFFIKFNNTNN